MGTEGNEGMCVRGQGVIFFFILSLSTRKKWKEWMSWGRKKKKTQSRHSVLSRSFNLVITGDIHPIRSSCSVLESFSFEDYNSTDNNNRTKNEWNVNRRVDRWLCPF
jgi:hypothetical protein